MKQATHSEYEKAVNRVIDYINRNLYSTPGIKEIAEVADISGFHFHRIFKAIIGENIGEFISRLRLEDIALRLLMTDDTLDDIALRTGYSNKHALSKAFKTYFSVSPSIYRKGAKNYHYFFSEKDMVTTALDCEIRHLSPKTIVYIRIIDVYGAEESYRDAWHKLGMFAKSNNLLNDSVEFIGLSFDDPAITHPGRCRFYAGFTPNRTVAPDGPFGVCHIPGGTYAVFVHRGAYHLLKNTYFNIYMRYLPHNGLQTSSSMSFEKYLNSPSNTDESELLTEIYVPIKRR